MTAASDVYEIVLYDTDTPTTGLRSWLGRVFTRSATSVDPSAVIISVRRIESGAELFRHIEDGGHDEDHLLGHINQDLASLTAEEFASRWAS